MPNKRTRRERRPVPILFSSEEPTAIASAAYRVWWSSSGELPSAFGDDRDGDFVVCVRWIHTDTRPDVDVEPERRS